MSNGSIFVISGPSGAGKGTLVGQIIKKRPDIFLSISCTTRAPRAGEVDGVNYHFVTKETFEQRIAEDYFLEWEKYLENYYGTPFTPMLEAVRAGRDVIVEIDVRGGMSLKKKYPEAVLVFVAPPDNQTLRMRLMRRGTETEEVIKKRMSEIKREYEYMDKYDYLLVNDDLDDCCARLMSVMDAERCKAPKNKELIKNLQAI